MVKKYTTIKNLFLALSPLKVEEEGGILISQENVNPCKEKRLTWFNISINHQKPSLFWSIPKGNIWRSAGYLRASVLKNWGTLKKKTIDRNSSDTKNLDSRNLWIHNILVLFILIQGTKICIHVMNILFDIQGTQSHVGSCLTLNWDLPKPKIKILHKVKLLLIFKNFLFHAES